MDRKVKADFFIDARCANGGNLWARKNKCRPVSIGEGF